MLKLRTPMCGDHRPHNDGLFFPLTGYNLQSPIWRWFKSVTPQICSMSPEKGTISKGKGLLVFQSQHFSRDMFVRFSGFKLQGRSHLGCGWRRSGGGFHGTENPHFHGPNLGPGRWRLELGGRFCCPNKSPCSFWVFNMFVQKWPCFLCWWDFVWGQCPEENLCFRTKVPQKGWKQIVSQKGSKTCWRLNL